METDNETADRFRRKMLAITEDFCALANDARVAGFSLYGRSYVDPDGVWHAMSPIVAKILPSDEPPPQQSA